MTAFDNIKANNWPGGSNEFEDFLVLKMPLNDNASLTESLPVNAGNKLLHPKRTLTNKGVFCSEAGSLKKHYANNAMWTSGIQPIIYGVTNQPFYTGAFTLEGWFYPTSVSGTWRALISDSLYQNTGGFNLYLTDAAALSFYVPYSQITSGGTVAVDTWQHVACTRDSAGAVRLFLNGSSVGNSATSNYSLTSDTITVGASNFHGSYNSHPFQGCIQDVRIYKGVAKYTSNFTPPGAILG